MPESTDAPPAIPAELVRWLCCTLIGMREALVRSGRVRREALDACTANAERDYDAQLQQQNRAAAASFEQMLGNPLMFPLEALQISHLPDQRVLDILGEKEGVDATSGINPCTRATISASDTATGKDQP